MNQSLAKDRVFGKVKNKEMDKGFSCFVFRKTWFRLLSGGYQVNRM